MRNEYRLSTGGRVASSSWRKPQVEVRLPADDVERLSFVEIRDRRNRELITVIEVLSPRTNGPAQTGSFTSTSVARSWANRSTLWKSIFCGRPGRSLCWSRSGWRLFDHGQPLGRAFLATGSGPSL